MAEVLVAPDDIAKQLRQHVRDNPDLRKEDYRTDSDPITGACYVLAEAYFHAQDGTDSGLEVYRLDWADVDDSYRGAHWFLQDEAKAIVDLSLPTPADGDDIPWDVARHRAFITGYTPSNRTQRVLEALNLSY